MRELLARVTSAELTEWRAYYRLDPWTEDRADLRAGTVASVVANCHTRDATFKPSDFIPDYGAPPEPEQTEEQMMAAAMRLTAAMGGTIRG